MGNPFESDDEDEEEIENGLWRSIKNHFPIIADIPFSNFDSLDDDVVTDALPDVNGGRVSAPNCFKIEVVKNKRLFL